MGRSKCISVDTSNNQMMNVSCEDGKVVVHLEYNEAVLNNAQVDELIGALKKMKSGKGE